MPNITLSIQEELLQDGRKYAQKHHTSLNALIRDLLKQVLKKNKDGWLKECFRLMDKHPVNSKGKKWPREDLYDV